MFPVKNMIFRFCVQLSQAENVVCRELHTSHAFHSATTDPMLEPLRVEVAKVRLREPSLPVGYQVTGPPATVKVVTDPAIATRKTRATVEFSKATLAIKEMGYDLFLECGPRSTLCS